MTEEKTLKFVEVSSIDELYKHNFRDISIAIGVFDGLHIGHRHLLLQLVSESRQNGSLPVVMTFFPHPRSLINDGQKILLLLPHHHKLRLLFELGIRAVVTIPFTADFASLPAQDFLTEFLDPQLVSLKAIMVGSGWRFGRGGEGNNELLAKFASAKGIKFMAVNELDLGCGKVSSSFIRRAVSNGDLAVAEKMLGRPYSLWGKVKKGLVFASKELGFPTANIEIGDFVIPPEGVYRGSAIVRGREYPAAISLGTAQSVRHDEKNRELLIEAHMLGFSDIIYGEEIEIKFFEYLREQRYFSEISKLKEQIEKDIKIVKSKATETQAKSSGVLKF